MKKLIEKFNSLNKKSKFIILSIFAAIIVIALLMPEGPKTETAYTKLALNICQNNKCKGFKPLQKIYIKKDSDKEYSVYLSEYSAEKIGIVAADNVVFEGTEDYDKAVKFQEENKKQLQAAKQQIKADMIAKVEPKINKIFYKVDIKQYNDMGAGSYNFYIDAVKWVALPYDKKEELFKIATNYAYLKTTADNEKVVRTSTKILNMTNKAILAEYDIINGIKLK